LVRDTLDKGARSDPNSWKAKMSTLVALHTFHKSWKGSRLPVATAAFSNLTDPFSEPCRLQQCHHT
jgi:hypothetical protein